MGLCICGLCDFIPGRPNLDPVLHLPARSDDVNEALANLLMCCNGPPSCSVDSDDTFALARWLRRCIGWLGGGGSTVAGGRPRLALGGVGRCCPNGSCCCRSVCRGGGVTSMSGFRLGVDCVSGNSATPPLSLAEVDGDRSILLA